VKFSSSFAETLCRPELEGHFPQAGQAAGQPRAVFGSRAAFCAGLFREIDRTQAERLHLPQRVGPAGGVKLPLGNLAVGPQRLCIENVGI
jgi:hypothetical protein